MPRFEKHFTVDEANALLPEIRTLLSGLREVRDHLVISMEGAAPVVAAIPNNGGGVEANPYLRNILQISSRVQQLSEHGVLLKDLDRGLVDFPAWREDQEILLCWHQGEDGVAFWHSVESGYASRAPI